MKWNWFVFLGSFAIILCAAVFPVISYMRYTSGGNAQQVTLTEPSGIFLAVIILLFMYSNWKGRVLAWSILGLTGAIWVPAFATAFYDAGKPFLGAMASTGDGTPYTAGMYLIIAGFVVVFAGAVWEYLRNKKSRLSVLQP